MKFVFTPIILLVLVSLCRANKIPEPKYLPPSLQTGERSLEDYPLNVLARYYKDLHTTILRNERIDLTYIEENAMNNVLQERQLSSEDIIDFAKGVIVGFGLGSLDNIGTCIDSLKSITIQTGELIIAFLEKETGLQLATRTLGIASTATDVLQNCKLFIDLIARSNLWNRIYNYVKTTLKAADFIGQTISIITEWRNGEFYNSGRALGNVVAKLAGITSKKRSPPLLEKRGFPGNWTCDVAYYEAADGCDCDCGVIDPDCYSDYTIFGCPTSNSSETRCNLITNECELINVPPEWTCPVQFYSNYDGCDCDCGVLDPDCALTPEVVFNCDTGKGPICDLNGLCQYVDIVPSEWYCDPLNYDADDGCHCGCGAVDPDCLKHTDISDPFYFVQNCPCPGMTCDAEFSVCIGVCDGFEHSVTEQQDSDETSSASFNSPFF